MRLFCNQSKDNMKKRRVKEIDDNDKKISIPGKKKKAKQKQRKECRKKKGGGGNK